MVGQPISRELRDRTGFDRCQSDWRHWRLWHRQPLRAVWIVALGTLRPRPAAVIRSKQSEVRRRHVRLSIRPEWLDDRWRPADRRREMEFDSTGARRCDELRAAIGRPA